MRRIEVCPGPLNRLLEPGQALDTARAPAHEVTRNAPLAVIVRKQLIGQSHTWAGDEMFSGQRCLAEPVANSLVAQEAALALAQKRPAISQTH